MNAPFTPSHPEALAVAFNRAIVEHFGPGGCADAEEVMVAGCTVVASYIAGIADPVPRTRLLARAQRALGVMVAQVAFEDAVRARGAES